MILRAALGLAIACALLHRGDIPTSPGLSATRADIAQAHAVRRLDAWRQEAASSLAARFETARAEILRPSPARRLQR